MELEVRVLRVDVVLGLVGKLLPVAYLHVIRLEFTHQLESFAHVFHLCLGVALHPVLFLLEFLFLQIHLDRRTLED